jgi:AAA family ATP:ADP antiporter
MIATLRHLLDIRRGELAPVVFGFSYVALVVAAFLLAKPIRNGLFLREYGPYALVYAYAAVPLVLSILVPLGSRIAIRVGPRAMTVGTLWFFCSNVLVMWALLRFADIWILPAVLYVWVNCFGVIAPVQAWSFVSSLFDTRQAKRLFGIVGAGASFGAIAGGLLGRLLIGPLGGTINLLLVLAALIAASAIIVWAAVGRMPHRGAATPRTRAGFNRPLVDALLAISRTPYLRLITAIVFLVAIATQWISFQFSLVADARYGGDADRLTQFFSSFNVYMGSVAFALQLVATGPILRRFGMTVTILLLPVALLAGSALILIAPVFWTVLATAGLDQGVRFSLDKATYELLYLPLTGRQRAQLKAAIDIVVNRTADALGAVLLGVATNGFFGLGGFGLGLRGTAAINVAIIGAWTVVAWRLRSAYLAAIGESIRSHRLETERAAAAAMERAGATAIEQKLQSPDETDILYALDVLEAQQRSRPRRALTVLLHHPASEIRRRALRLLNEIGDRQATADVGPLIRDPDLETRAEALLYLSRHARVDPLAAVRDLHEFPEFSIRASTAAFLAAPGPAQNVEAARAILQAMIHEAGPEAARVRHEAARLVELRPEAFRDEIPTLLAPEEDSVDVLRHAIRAAGRLGAGEFAHLLLPRLADPALSLDAIEALADCGDAVLPAIGPALSDESLPLEARRELPLVLARIGTPAAQQQLLDALLQGDAALRYRIISALNKLRQLDADSALDPEVIELVLAAEIAGHYRSYQVLAALGENPDANDPVVQGLRHSMDHEMERIFRLMSLVMPGVDLHSAYVALRASDRTVRAHALEFLESSLKPELVPLLLPLIDPEVTLAARVRMANALVGARIDSLDGAIRTLLASDDAWLRETARAAQERLWEAPAARADEPESEAPAAASSGL